MLYRIRTGDILLCENKGENKTLMYLITYNSLDGYTLTCLSCGEKIGYYKDDKNALLRDLKGFLNLIQIIPKEVIAELINEKYHPKMKLSCHDTFKEHELGIEIEL